MARRFESKRLRQAKTITCLAGCIVLALLLLPFYPTLTAPAPKGPRGSFAVGWSPSGAEQSCGVYNNIEQRWYFICYVTQYLYLSINEVSHEATIQYMAAFGKTGLYSLQVLLPISIMSFSYHSGTIAKW